MTLPGSPVTVLLWPKTGGSLASPSTVVSGRGPSSWLKTKVFLPSRTSTGKISASRRPAFIASTGGELRMESPFVLLRSAEAEFVGDFRTMQGHMSVVEGAPETVVDHQVDGRLGRQADLGAPAHLRQTERGVGHALLTAGDADLRPAELNHLHREVDCLDSRGTDLVDGDARDRFGKTRQDGGLATGDLAGSGGDDLPHEDIVHIGRLDLPLRPAEDLLDGQGAEFLGGKSLERPAEPAIGGSAGLNQDDFPELGGRFFLPTTADAADFR